MGIIQNWIDRKRRKELERINYEIEELKRRGPDFSHRESDKKSIKKPTLPLATAGMGSGKSHFQGKGFAVILFIFLVAVIVFHMWNTRSLNDEYDKKEQEALLLRDQLDLALAHLNKPESELGVKKIVEANLSEQSQDLQQEIVDLQDAMSSLNLSLSNEIGDLRVELAENDKYTDALKICIKNDSISDKEDCL